MGKDAKARAFQDKNNTDNHFFLLFFRNTTNKNSTAHTHVHAHKRTGRCFITGKDNCSFDKVVQIKSGSTQLHSKILSTVIVTDSPHERSMRFREWSKMSNSKRTRYRFL